MVPGRGIAARAVIESIYDGIYLSGCESQGGGTVALCASSRGNRLLIFLLSARCLRPPNCNLRSTRTPQRGDAAHQHSTMYASVASLSTTPVPLRRESSIASTSGVPPLTPAQVTAQLPRASRADAQGATC